MICQSKVEVISFPVDELRQFLKNQSQSVFSKTLATITRRNMRILLRAIRQQCNLVLAQKIPANIFTKQMQQVLHMMEQKSHEVCIVELTETSALDNSDLVHSKDTASKLTTTYAVRKQEVVKMNEGTLLHSSSSGILMVSVPARPTRIFLEELEKVTAPQMIQLRQPAIQNRKLLNSISCRKPLGMGIMQGVDLEDFKENSRRMEEQLPTKPPPNMSLHTMPTRCSLTSCNQKDIINQHDRVLWICDEQYYKGDEAKEDLGEVCYVKFRLGSKKQGKSIVSPEVPEQQISLNKTQSSQQETPIVNYFTLNREPTKSSISTYNDVYDIAPDQWDVPKFDSQSGYIEGYYDQHTETLFFD